MTGKPKYSYALRTIGQDLEARHIQSFDLIKVADDYSVQPKTETLSIKHVVSQGYKQFWPERYFGIRWNATHSQDNGGTPSDSAGATQFRYPPEELSRLELAGREKRGTTAKFPDFLSLSQVLRAVGAMLDLRGGELISLTRPARLGALQSLNLKYETGRGELKDEDHSFCNIYDFSVRMYKQRYFWTGHQLRKLASGGTPLPNQR